MNKPNQLLQGAKFLEQCERYRLTVRVGKHTSTIAPAFALVASITGLGRKSTEETTEKKKRPWQAAFSWGPSRRARYCRERTWGDIGAMWKEMKSAVVSTTLPYPDVLAVRRYIIHVLILIHFSAGNVIKTGFRFKDEYIFVFMEK